MKLIAAAPALALLLAFSSILSAGGAQKSSSARTSSGDTALDPCALLTAHDIQRAQGERFSNVRKTEQATGDFRLLQCFYATPSPAKSVSLTVAVPREAGAVGSSGAWRYWQERFHTGAAKNEKHDIPGEDDKEESRPPLKVTGVGEEAYWMGNRLAGALYVLFGERFLRISLGGGEPEEVKRRKSIGLAKAALDRIRK